jgi:hypothetical protein
MEGGARQWWSKVNASRLTLPPLRPAINRLTKPVMSTQRQIGLMTLRGYLIVAFALVVVKIVAVAIHG